MISGNLNARPIIYGELTTPRLEVTGVGFDTVFLGWQTGFEAPEAALDWKYEYRAIGDKFWSPTGNPNTGSAGLTGSPDQGFELSGLLESTLYEFRVKACTKSGRDAPWSDPVLWETYPNIPLFDTSTPYPNKLFVNSPTNAYEIGAVVDGTIVNTPDQGLVTLNRGDVLTGAAVQGDIIEATEPFNGVARIGNEPYELMAPRDFGKKFVFNQVRANPQEVFIFAAQDANIVLKRRNDASPANDTTYATAFIAGGTFQSFTWSATRTHEITSDGYIAVFALSSSPNYTNPFDQKPIYPASAEVMVSPSTGAYASVFFDDSSIEWQSAEGDFAGKLLNDRNAYYAIPRGSIGLVGDGRYHTCGWALVKSNKLLFVASVADSNGIAQTVGVPTKNMGTRFTLHSASERVSIGSKSPTKVRMFYPGNTTAVPDEEHTLKGAAGGGVYSFYWGNRQSPFDANNGIGATFGVVPVGTYIEADAPIAAVGEVVAGATEYGFLTV